MFNLSMLLFGEKVNFEEKEIFGLPAFPRFVVITITPLAARAP